MDVHIVDVCNLRCIHGTKKVDVFGDSRAAPGYEVPFRGPLGQENPFGQECGTACRAEPGTATARHLAGRTNRKRKSLSAFVVAGFGDTHNVSARGCEEG